MQLGTPSFPFEQPSLFSELANPVAATRLDPATKPGTKPGIGLEQRLKKRLGQSLLQRQMRKTIWQRHKAWQKNCVKGAAKLVRVSVRVSQFASI